MTATEQGRVPLGTPITTEQATRAVLRLLKTPIVGNVDADASPGTTLQRIKTERSGLTYDLLSKGERRLVDIAYAIWRGDDTEGASIGAIGGLDRHNRRAVIIILAYLYLGRDLALELDEVAFARSFGDR